MQPRLPIAQSAAETSQAAEGLPDSSNAEIPGCHSMTVAGLFAGIGGLEFGLHLAGHESSFLCEFDAAARSVLEVRFPGVQIWGDVVELQELPPSDVVVAGFPCQDLSLAGRATGIGGERSGLVWEIFRLLDSATTEPKWLVLENVPFLLQLQKGDGMRLLIGELERRGFNWAYRVLDTRAFGLPQRRQRVIILASRSHDPRGPLLGSDSNGPALAPHDPMEACGFYWTEGHRGVGWSEGCVPPIKVGSGVGIPSPPAVWFPDSGIVVAPDIRDLERLQGFEVDWTEPAEAAGLKRQRWKLVGNAVSVPVAKWLGERLKGRHRYDDAHDWPLATTGSWPTAAWGIDGRRHESSSSMWPVSEQLPGLAQFLQHPGQPLSSRAVAGLLGRLERYGARVPTEFIADLRSMVESGESPVVAAALES